MSLTVLILSYGKSWLGPSRLPKIFSSAGFKVTLLTQHDSIASRTRYVDKLITVFDKNEFMLQLDRELASVCYDLVIPSDDETIHILGDSGADPATSRGYMSSKADFTRFAIENDLPIPRSLAINEVSDLDLLEGFLRFPIVLKPASGCAGNGIVVLDTAKELEVFRENYTGKQLVAQEYVVGRLGMAICFYRAGVLRGWMSVYKSKTYFGAYGPSAANATAYIPHFEPVLIKIGRATSFDGFLGVDFIENDDTIKIIEINWRAVPQIHIGKRVGVDFVKVIRDSFHLQSPDGVSYQRPEHRYFYLFPQDIYRCIEKSDKTGFLKWFLLPSRWRDIMWDDPSILLWHVKDLYKRLHGYKMISVLTSMLSTKKTNNPDLVRQDTA